MEKDILDDDKQRLLIRCLRNEASAREMEEAFVWVNYSAHNMGIFEKMKEFWLARCLELPVSPDQQNRSWKRINERIRQSEVAISACSTNIPGQMGQSGETMQYAHFKTTREEHSPELARRERPRDMFRMIPVYWSRMAAAVVIAFILGTISTALYQRMLQSHQADDVLFTIEAPRGAKSTITMVDGSKVFLNAGSRISYPESYNQKNRDIHLEGEGYFVVAKNENIPFRVHAPGIVVEALGTEFNVKAYPEDDRVETTLVKGIVSIARSGVHDQSQPIILKPNQKASVYFDRHEINEIAEKQQSEPGKPLTAISRPVRVRTESNINTETATSWKEARWIFERESMASLAEKLERQYDIHITFKDEELKQYHLTGTLEEESIEQVLKALQLALPIDFHIAHKNVYLSLSQQRKNNFKHLLK